MNSRDEEGGVMERVPGMSDGWPANSIPKHWVEALFSRMSAFYGDGFTRMWRGSEVSDVQKTWGVELFKLSREQLKAGSNALSQIARAPSLPEFIAHCKQARKEMVEHTAPKLEDNPSVTPEVAARNIGNLRKAASKIRPEPSAEWAYKLLIRGISSSSHKLPPGVVRCATDAITSTAGRKVIENCIDAELKARYTEMRDSIIENYREIGRPLWDIR